MSDFKDQAIRILRDEHRSLSAVLDGLKYLADQAMDASVRPDFAVFRAMIHYIDEFPESLHHPKEDQHLFARVAARSPEAQPLVDGLRAAHQTGAKLIRDLEHALLSFEQRWPVGASNFGAAVQAYADFHWQHMGKEERELLPLAERVLTAEDWQAIFDAFAANQDPIAQVTGKEFDKLFARIVAIAPEPIGLGERWKKTVA